MNLGEDQSQDEEEIEPVKRRGRHRIPEQWTRVISLRTDNPEDYKTYPVHQDLEVAESMVRAPLRRRKPGDDEPVFWPADALDSGKELSLASYSLSEPKLRKYAEQISKLRKRLRDDAKSAALADSEPELELDQRYLSKLLERMHKGYFPKVATEAYDIITEPTPVMMRKKGKRRPMLTTGDKLAILH